MYIQVRQHIGKIVGMEIKIPKKLEKDLEPRLALQRGSPLPLRLQWKIKKMVQKQTPSSIHFLKVVQVERDWGSKENTGTGIIPTGKDEQGMHLRITRNKV